MNRLTLVLMLGLALLMSACAHDEPIKTELVVVTKALERPALAAECKTKSDPTSPPRVPRPDQADGSLSERGTIRDRNHHREVIAELRARRDICEKSIDKAFPPEPPAQTPAS